MNIARFNRTWFFYSLGFTLRNRAGKLCFCSTNCCPSKKKLCALKTWFGHQLFDSESITRIFSLYETIFEPRDESFIIKPYCWGTNGSLEIYQLLLQFSIISLSSIEKWWICQRSIANNKNPSKLTIGQTTISANSN